METSSYHQINILSVFWLGITSMWVEGAVQNSCFLNNGACRYHIRVNSNCDSHVQTGPTQLDGYILDGPNAIEKYLLQTKTDHSKRISELEGKLKAYTELKPEKVVIVTPKPLETKLVGAVPDSKSSTRTKKKRRLHNSTGFKKDPQRKENHLLNRIHKEFTVLRNELQTVEKHLSNSEKLLHRARTQLNETETDNLKLTKQLLHTENKLVEEQTHTHQLQKKLTDNSNALNSTKSKLKDTESVLRRIKLDYWKIKSENVDCKKDLEQCLLDKDRLREALEQALIRYHDLNLKHENVTFLLNETREDLYACRRGKTTQFCGFEDPDVCGFESGEGDLEWLRWNEATSSAYTGPAQDYTCQNKRGYYMYVEVTKRQKGELATLISPRYYGYGEQCIEFRYHMYGYHVGTLKVMTMVPNQDAAPMWRAMGNQGDVWSMARITVPAKEANKGYQVVFEVTVGFGNAGDIAVDDFRIFDGGCFDKAPTTNDVPNKTSN